MNTLSLAIRQIKYENLAFWRNPVSAFFTFIFPLMFLAIFNLLFGNRELEVPGGITHTSTFYVPSIMALSVTSACYTNVAMSMTFSRDQGLLKRIRGSPLPVWAFLFGRITTMLIVTMLLVTIVATAGVVFYDVDLPDKTFPAFISTLLIGSATFCILGIAITSVIPNAQAAPAVVNASILPLLFISDVFIPMNDAPRWLINFTQIFPVKPFTSALHTAFNPFETGLGFEFADMGVLVLWAVIGALIAIRFFSWEPRQ